MEPVSRRLKASRLVVGLTGGLGSGKSTVLGMLKKLGADWADADLIVRRALEPSGAAYGPALRLFGPAIRRADRTLDRGAMAEKVFKDPALRKSLEKILHPLVEREFKRKISSLRSGVLVLDAPLLYEAGMAKLADKVLVVWAPKSLCLKRLMKSGRFSRRDIEARMRAQWPLEEKRRRADWVIDNSGSMRDTRRQVQKLWRRRKSLSR